MIPQAAAFAISNRKTIMRLVGVGLTAFLGIGIMLALIVPALLGGGSDDGVLPPVDPVGNTGCTIPPGALPSIIDVPGLTPAQDAEATANFAIAISVGKGLSLPPAAWKVAIMTMLVESSGLNLDHGDRDSLGLYQQRPSSGWGTPADIMDPVKATLAFYGQAAHTSNPGLTDIAGWQTRILTDPGGLAQAVQRSAFPTRYAEKEGLAALAVAALSGVREGICTPATPTNPGSPTGPWTLPMVAGTFVVTSEYGMRVNPATGVYNLHGGTDFSGPCGTPEVAASAGIVVHAGPGIAWAGNYVVIDHGGGITTWYAHMVSTSVTVGTTVTPGQQVGLEGTTGNSTGCHLHFETRVNDQPVPTRPFMSAHGVTIPPEG